MREFIKNELLGWKKSEVIWLVISVSIILALSIYWKENVIGIISSITGILCVVLVGKGKMSSYIFGLINTSLYAFIAFSSKFYGDAMLNAFYYVPMQFIGWVMWKKKISAKNYEVEKERLTIKENFIYLSITSIIIIIYGFILSKLGGRLPYIDSISTCLSILAMIFTVKRLMEQWVLWIIINAVSIYMWVDTFIQNQSDVATLLMWIVYFINSVIMLIKWIKDTKPND
ncbi:nicotinamide riboside transporter PnuC [[Clostridium] colinum]|uniref:nicotinamide riboside transporter PnuC n=1 Tax=[Clostridium] colinum TaxID=36835 RepID=UPI002024CD0B|nr:nicotinamide riboside transporter PnuC [[Clostridium] colinum]